MIHSLPGRGRLINKTQPENIKKEKRLNKYRCRTLSTFSPWLWLARHWVFPMKKNILPWDFERDWNNHTMKSASCYGLEAGPGSGRLEFCLVSVSNRRVWRRTVRCSWARGRRPACASCTIWDRFWRRASPSLWTSGWGTCGERGVRQLGKYTKSKQSRCVEIETGQRAAIRRFNTRRTPTCWAGA